MIKQAFHVVLTTHNSRTSQRMIKYKVENGPAFELNLDQEIKLTKIIAEIILEKKYRCIAYNICRDHVHLIIVCLSVELTKIIKTIKGKSAYLFLKDHNAKNDFRKTLWSQKFFRADLDIWELNSRSEKGVYQNNSSYLENAISYITYNREKHELKKSELLEEIISLFVKPWV